MLLRPHHSLCIQFFVGKGYNEEFIINMTEIINFLSAEDPFLTLTSGCDIVCSSCPNNIGGLCRDNEKVNCTDKNCLAEYSLNFGDKIRWSELKALAFQNIIDKGKLNEVCGNCQWHLLCKNE